MALLHCYDVVCKARIEYVTWSQTWYISESLDWIEAQRLLLQTAGCYQEAPTGGAVHAATTNACLQMLSY